MTKICLTCEITKKLNKAELEKTIPEWYKEIGNYSLLPPFLNNNDKYNANKRTLQTIKPDITQYEVNIKLNEKPNTWICYWAADYANNYMKIKDAKKAYDKFKNHGLVKTDSKGDVKFVLNCPQPYSVDNVTYPRHVHYCLLNKNNFWSDDVSTLVVSCKIDFKLMKEYVPKKCHFIINSLPKDNYDRCHIPNSFNLPVSLLEKSSNSSKKMIVKDFLEEKLSNYPRINKLVKSGKLSIYNIPIVVYCAHSKCHASENLIEHLIEAGFVNLLEYPGGIKQWKLREKDKLQDTCFFDDKDGGGDIKEIRKETTNWLYSGDDDDKGSKTKSNDDKEVKEVKEEKVKKDEEVKKDKENKGPEFNLKSNVEKIVINDKIYKHNIETDEIFEGKKLVGKLNNSKIDFIEEDDDSSSEDDSSDSDSSDEEDDEIKYKKQKLKVTCMSDVTPKVYNEKFRGWIFTYWG